MNFHKPKDLPRLMVAPNGARQTVETALACDQVQWIHCGRRRCICMFRTPISSMFSMPVCIVRRYRNVLGAAVPSDAMHFQITSEAVGRCTPRATRQCAGRCLRRDAARHIPCRAVGDDAGPPADAGGCRRPVCYSALACFRRRSTKRSRTSPARHVFPDEVVS